LLNIIARASLFYYTAHTKNLQGGIDMRVTEYLDKSAIPYEVTEHPPTFTAQQMAAVEHEPGKFVAKPVIVKVDGKYMMCVLSANNKIDLAALKSQLGAESIELADEKEIGKIFDDCELGAEPPFGNLYDLPTIMDKALVDDDHILFQAGTHKEAIQMSMADYRKLVEPKVLEFSYHVTS
jgi:Ala-tRNA(Pro) deacylase